MRSAREDESQKGGGQRRLTQAGLVAAWVCLALQANRQTGSPGQPTGEMPAHGMTTARNHGSGGRGEGHATLITGMVLILTAPRAESSGGWQKCRVYDDQINALPLSPACTHLPPRSIPLSLPLASAIA